VSIGLAEITAHSESLAAVMSAADVACYSAKDSGRNRVQTYRQGRAPERHREMQWVSRIHRACEEDRLLLVCQPIVPIRAGVEKLRHFELLLRMKDENGMLVQPSEFIPAAERFNLMPALDRWVVRQACTRHAHRRGDTERAPFTLAINVSATTLNDEQFLDFVLAEMAAADVSPGALCFEMTETAAMSSLANAKHFVRELRERGCRFSLDDFGSGLSSFIFLKNLPVDFLKIDGQFMHNVAHDRVDRGLVEAIAQIGQTMGIRTIAERQNGVMVANAQGTVLAYALFNLQERGRLMVAHGDEVYEGQIVGIHSRDNDLVVNPLKAKKLTNIRAAGRDENIILVSPVRMTLEQAMEFIDDDELVEVTPASIRLRKRALKEHQRRRASRLEEA